MTGPELRAARKRLGWSQKRLAGALGVPKNTLARWERGEVRIRHPDVLRLALEMLAIRFART